MTASDEITGTWKPAGPPFSSYEASDGRDTGRGRVRSVDRVLPDGRRRKGVLLAQRRSSRGYWQVNVTDDDGRKRTVEVHALQMLAFEGPCPPGMQVRHWDDNPDSNVWAPGGEEAIRAGGPGRLVYGTPKQNHADKLRNRVEIIPLEPRAVGYRQSRPAERRMSRRVRSYVASRVRRWLA